MTPPEATDPVREVARADLDRIPSGSVVVGIDGSPWSHHALDWAADQAALEQRPLVLVHAVAPLGAHGMDAYAASGIDYVRILDDGRAWAQALLDGQCARAKGRHPELAVHDLVSVSDPRTLLLDLSERASMVVVGSRGRGPVASLVLGSVSVSLSRHASCPVVVQRASQAHKPLGRVLVGVDGSAPSMPAIELAFRVASFRRATLTVLHCCWAADPVPGPSGMATLADLGPDRALVSESLAGMGEKFPDVVVTVELATGPPDSALAAASAAHDLVVVGHQQVGPLTELLHDSVAAAVLEHAEGPVAVVPSPRPRTRPRTRR